MAVWYFCGERKKNKKNICKTYTHPPHGRLRKPADAATSKASLGLGFVGKIGIQIFGHESIRIFE